MPLPARRRPPEGLLRPRRAASPCPHHQRQCPQQAGRAAVIHNGLNQINVPYTNRVPAYQDIVVDGLFGTCAEVRQSGWQIGNWPDSTSVQNYSIVTGGSGYSNGYWGLPVTATAGGSGAYCIVKVETNTITCAYPAKAGTGTGWVTVGTNAVGSTNILIGSGSGYIFPGDKIKFTGDGTTYTVNSVSNNAAMTLTAGTSVGLASRLRSRFKRAARPRGRPGPDTARTRLRLSRDSSQADLGHPSRQMSSEPQQPHRGLRDSELQSGDRIDDPRRHGALRLQGTRWHSHLDAKRTDHDHGECHQCRAPALLDLQASTGLIAKMFG